MGKRIFIDDQEMTNKNDFDNKVNVDRSLYQLQQSAPLTETDIFNTDDTQGRLQVIHQRTNENGTETFGGFDNILLFGGDNITSILDTSMRDNKLKIAVGDSSGKALWSEFVAWKSDIERLEQEISDLKKQIGGVTRHLYARLISALATSTEMEVA